MMVDMPDSSLQERLRQAEQAEAEVMKLQPLAAEAPQLRAEVAKAQRREARERVREKAMEDAQKASQAAAQEQSQVPVLLETATRAVYELFTRLREIDTHRREAMQSLAIVDRADYDVELEATEAEQRALGRDTRGLDYVLAARHGEHRVKQLMTELGVDFDYLKDCNLSDTLRRDVANFTLEHAVTSQGDEVPTLQPTATPSEQSSSPVGRPPRDENC